MDTVLIRKEETSRGFAGVSGAPRTTTVPPKVLQRRGRRRLASGWWNEERGHAGRRTYEPQTGTCKLAIYPVGEDDMGDDDSAGRCQLAIAAHTDRACSSTSSRTRRTQWRGTPTGV